jgi:hypothetical protein
VPHFAVQPRDSGGGRGERSSHGAPQYYKEHRADGERGEAERQRRGVERGGDARAHVGREQDVERQLRQHYGGLARQAAGGHEAADHDAQRDDLERRGGARRAVEAYIRSLYCLT